jgi:hypothetical protein
MKRGLLTCVLRVFENRALRITFGSKRNEVTTGRRKLHKKLHNLHYSPHMFRILKPTAIGRTRNTDGKAGNVKF